jgi:hypothetical protein
VYSSVFYCGSSSAYPAPSLQYIVCCCYNLARSVLSIQIDKFKRNIIVLPTHVCMFYCSSMVCFAYYGIIKIMYISSYYNFYFLLWGSCSVLFCLYLVYVYYYLFIYLCVCACAFLLVCAFVCVCILIIFL